MLLTFLVRHRPLWIVRQLRHHNGAIATEYHIAKRCRVEHPKRLHLHLCGCLYRYLHRRAEWK